jgi:hypothetical protein
MTTRRKTPLGEEKWVRPQEETEAPVEPTSTGDMQEVGAVEPEEVEERRDEVDAEPPVHENPGDQTGG